jgi:AAA domain
MSFTDEDIQEAIAIARGKPLGAERRANGSTATHDAVSKPFDFVLAGNISIEPKDYLINGFLGRYEVSAWYGPPDSAKSVILVHAMACVAAAVVFCGRGVAQGPCLYVAAERGAIIRRRVLAWCKEHGLPDIPLAIVDHAIDLRSGKVDTDRVIATAAELARQCKAPVAWINFDTYNRILAGGDENSSKDAGAVLAAIDRIHRETNAHVSLVHHVPVDRTDRMRGHGLILGGVDQTNRITKDEVVRLETDKANDLVDKPAFAFTIKSVSIHIDEETGVETTAPVLLEMEAAPAHNKTAPRRLTDRQVLAIKALEESLFEFGKAAPASLQLPATTMVVTLELWRKTMFNKGVLDKEAANPRKDYERIRDQLHARQIIGVLNDLVWRV